MKIYTCTGEVYVDGLTNGGSTRYFATKAEAITSAKDHTSGSATDNYLGDEVTVGWDRIARTDLATVVNMLNHEAFSSDSGHICTIRNGKIIKD